MTWKIINHSNIKENQYSVSDNGDVRNNNTGKILKRSLDKDGYVVYKLPNKQGKIKTYKGHRLVAKSFLKRKLFNNKLNIVNHINGIKNDNRLSNLEWTDVYGNNLHAVKTGLRDINGSKNGKAIYSEELIEDICKLISEGYTNSEIIELVDIPCKGKSRTVKHAVVSGIRKFGHTFQINTCKVQRLSKTLIFEKYGIGK